MGEDKLNRVFIGINFPSEVVEEVGRVQELLRKWNFTGKLTERENLHLTFKFLGEIGQEKLEEVRKRLREIKFEGFEALLGEVGTFSYRGKPRIVWVKVMGRGIFELQKNIDSALEKEGYEKEARFMGHMTIARIKYVGDVKGFREFVSGIKLRGGRFRIEDFKMIESDLQKMGPVYTVVEDYR